MTIGDEALDEDSTEFDGASDSGAASACDVFSASDEASDAAVESASKDDKSASSVDVDWACLVVAADDVDPVKAPGSVAV